MLKDLLAKRGLLPSRRLCHSARLFIGNFRIARWAGRNLDKIIPIEARKYIPVPISDGTDWWVIPKREGQGTPSVPGKND